MQFKFYSSVFVIFFCINISYLIAQTPDPGIDGAYTVASQEYDFGDEAYTPPSFPDAVEVTGSVHYPEDLSDGPFPVLLFLHGRHSTCFNPATGNTNIAWPCTGSYTAIPSYTGYDYLAEHFASLGYIVISISANSISSTDNFVADYGMQARGELIQYHLDLWNTWNTVGGDPFGTTFVGKLDMNNIGTMGHSRGGEGVIFNALYNKELGSPYGINAVLTLAPVDFNRHVLTGTPLLNLAPYCDGDVSDLQGVHFYDDARYLDMDDEAPKHGMLLLGANHNYFNTTWTPGLFPAGTSDDWDYVDWFQNDEHCGTSNPDNDRLDNDTQRNSLLAYASAFFRYYIGGENAFAPYMEVDDVIPPVSSTLDSSQVFISFQPSNRKKINLNTQATEDAESMNNLSADVTTNGLTSFDICGDDYYESYCLDLGYSQEPHCSSYNGLSQLGIAWNSDDDYYDNALPDDMQDFTQFDAIQFRASVNFVDASTALDFNVELIDADGNSSVVSVSDYSNALFFPPGDFGSTLPRIMHNTIKIPLADFTGVDLSAITNVRFDFDETTLGAILISDLLLSSHDFVYFSPTAAFTANITSTCTGEIQFTDQSDNYPEEWFWDFGDGITSTEKNPLHLYTANGIYTVTLSVANPVGEDMISYTAFIEVNKPEAPIVFNDTICAGESAALSATTLSGGIINWYDALESETIIYSGDTFSIAPDITTNYFAEELIEAPLLSVGPVDNSFGSGGYFDSNDSRGIFFNVEIPIIIESVKVYAVSSGERTIEVLDGEGGPVIQSTTINIPSGESIVELGFNLEPNDNYYIKVTGDLVDLFRINDGSPDYPYSIADVISLTGSNVEGEELDFYYFFFDWKVREPECVSERVVVSAIVNPSPEVITSGDVTIISGESTTLSASGGIIFSWVPTTGLSDPTIANPIANPTETTEYTVTVTNDFDCSSEASLTVEVKENTAIENILGISEILIYPNPNNGIFTLQINQVFNAFQLQIKNSVGQLVYSQKINTANTEINLLALTKGIYLLEIKTTDSVFGKGLVIE
ncbi:MAG: PKD domain-containing protein [Bacteroidetes bacterium]|nr:PKD domain-containing protein [Bacteroidota bacterium]